METINLNESLLLGEGRHKVVYAHPTDSRKCIKIMKDSLDTELERELKYHRALARRGKKLSMLVEYYGEVETNFGKGYLFERVMDYTGETSRELSFVLDNPAETQKLLGCTTEDVLHRFHDMLLEQKLVVSNIDSYNYMIQLLSPTKYTIRAIDNIGTPAHVPLAYYFDFLALKHIKKYWARFAKRYSEKYPGIFPKDLLK